MTTDLIKTLEGLSSKEDWSSSDRILYNNSLPQIIDALKDSERMRKDIQDIKTQVGYEIEQANHYYEVAVKMGMEKRFSFVRQVAGFERIDGQLKQALTPTADTKESE